MDESSTNQAPAAIVEVVEAAEKPPFVEDGRADVVLDFVIDALAAMGMDCTVDLLEPDEEDPPEEIRLEIEGRDAGWVIGKKGQTLSALQFVANRVINRPTKTRRHVIIDAEGYRARREDALASMARRLGKQAVDEGKIITFEPMSPQDRRIVHLALAKFDSSFPTVAYSFSRFLSVDFVDTLRRRRHYYAELIAAPKVEITTPAGLMTCTFQNEIEVANQDDLLHPGWLYSVAEFFEASIINLAGDGSSYRLEGAFGFEGFIYLCNSEDMAERSGKTLQRLTRAARQGQNVLWFVDNHVTRVMMGGEDLTETFMTLVEGKERGSASTEFAIGCVESEEPHNWACNSLLHESAHGVHVGVGMARQIPHMDFIAPHARCHFLATPGGLVAAQAPS